MNNKFYVYETENGSRHPLTRQQYNQLIKTTDPDQFIIRIEYGENFDRFVFKKLNL